MKIRFHCPCCHCERRLEEIMVDVVQATSFDTIYKELEYVEVFYLDSSTDGGIVDRYQCTHCGTILTDDDGIEIDSLEKLYEWLFNHHMLFDEESR